MTEPSDEDGVAIVCDRTSPEPEIVTSGSIVGNCSECEADIWIAPSSVSISTKRYSKSRFICIPCFFKHVAKGAKPEIKSFPEQWTEIAENLRKREQT